MRNSQECLHQFWSCSLISGCRPHLPSRLSWWWWNMSRRSQILRLPFWYVVSNLPIMMRPEYSSYLQTIQRIPVYWGCYFLQRRSIFYLCPIACSQIPWSLQIHQRPHLYIVSVLCQQWCGGLFGVVSMPQWLQNYFVNLLLLELLLMTELLLLHFHCVLLLFNFWFMVWCCFICVLCHGSLSKQSKIF